MKIIDAHTHIDFITPNFQSEVIGCVCCATQESDWNKIAGLIKSDNRVYGAFGIHPWFVENVADDFDVALEQFLKTNSFYMIGEIGLDKHKTNMKKQMDVFIKQFNLAIKLKRNVCLHCVGAWDKMLYVFKQYKKSDMPKIIVHNFNEKDDILTHLLKYENLYFSIGKNALYGKTCRIEHIPFDRILVETDGEKDVLLKDIILKISQIKNDLNISNVIYNNTLKVLSNG